MYLNRYIPVCVCGVRVCVCVCVCVSAIIVVLGNILSSLHCRMPGCFSRALAGLQC